MSKLPLVAITLSTLSDPTLRSYLWSPAAELERHSEDCNCTACLKVSAYQGEEA